MQVELPRWYDLHAHFRQGPLMPALVRDHLSMGCAGVLAMPNTKPPVSRVAESDPGDGWTLAQYRDMLLAAGADAFEDIIIPLYLTGATTPAMIAAGAKSGLLRAAKYYPPHGTTGADHGQPFQTYIDNGVFQTMQDNGVVLCVHGEEHGLSGPDYFDSGKSAEDLFYRERLPRALDACPGLKIVGEHVTTKTAVNVVKSAGPNVAATVTPQHLLYTAGHLLQGFKYHLYCLPLVKFAADRAALREAVTDPANTKFFAGTDSAPHTNKLTPCGCAAGCYTGGIAPQLYAQAFDDAGGDVRGDAFKNFLCLNGPAFYGLKPASGTFRLAAKAGAVAPLETPEGLVMPLPLGMGADPAAALSWSIV